ncbi:hypothetical protein ABZZ36_09925 [Actinacidiphila glaucinigra]|uniref:hypothetical protein n=1 Tax=Actinacidiphila glaucinigra TaxID=235986 RepID=UPI0033AF619A
MAPEVAADTVDQEVFGEADSHADTIHVAVIGETTAISRMRQPARRALGGLRPGGAAGRRSDHPRIHSFNGT